MSWLGILIKTVKCSSPAAGPASGRVVILVEIKGVFARMQVNTAVGKLCHELITQ